MAKTGVLLINLGTPEAPTVEKVRSYLEEFLMDERVIDIPFIARWLLVHGIVLRKRPAQTAELYKKIWTDKGSPLLLHMRNAAGSLQQVLGEKYSVKIGMRYGMPSILTAIGKLKEEGATDIITLPLYPQYTTAATESSVEETRLSAESVGYSGRLTFAPAFYNNENFIEAFRQVSAPVIESTKPDHVIFSFHGLPERQIKKLDETGNHCFKSETCCDQIIDANKNCYRAQCFATAKLLSLKLNLKSGGYSVSFQSRMEGTPWIKPYTDELYRTLPSKGVKRLAVVSPSFVSDCLETLEEIAIRGKDEFVRSGGKELVLVPSLNNSPAWIDCLAKMVADLEARNHSH